MDEVVNAIEKYKGLVPLVYDIETMSLDEARPEDIPYAVYLKREADKVIARQKYKRCMAMANYWLVISYHCLDVNHHQKAEKRYYKLLKLAEKFKD